MITPDTISYIVFIVTAWPACKNIFYAVVKTGDTRHNINLSKLKETAMSYGQLASRRYSNSDGVHNVVTRTADCKWDIS